MAALSVLVFGWVWSQAKKLANDTVVEGDKIAGALIESRSSSGE
jgi:hypothetical protein